MGGQGRREGITGIVVRKPFLSQKRIADKGAQSPGKKTGGKKTMLQWEELDPGGW